MTHAAANGPPGRQEKAFLVTVGAFAAWVVLWTWPWPELARRTLPWALPPLHARVVGSLYAAGAWALWGSLRVQQRAALRLPLLWAVVWTGLLLAVSLRNLDAFDARSSVVWFWWGAYAIFPLWGAALWWRLPRTEAHAPPDRWLALLAVAALALGLGLLGPSAAVLQAWPWPLPPLLAQIYAGPCLACAVVLAAMAHRPDAPGAGLMRTALAVLVALLLLASLLHASLFKAAQPVTWVWACTLALALAALTRSRGRRLPLSGLEAP